MDIIQVIGEVIGRLVEREVTEAMIETEVRIEVVIMAEEDFVEEIMQIEVMNLGIETIVDLGDSPDLGKDKERDPPLVLDHVLVQEQPRIEIELDVLDVGNTIIMPEIAQIHRQMLRIEKVMVLSSLYKC